MKLKITTTEFNKISCFDNAWVLAGSSMIFKNDQAFYLGNFEPEHELLPEQISGVFHRGFKSHLGHLDRIYPFNLQASGNYFHFLIEHFPSLLSLLRVGKLTPEITIVSGLLHKNILFALDLILNGANQIVQLPKNCTISAREIIATSGSFTLLERHDKTMPSKVRISQENLSLAQMTLWEKLDLHSQMSSLSNRKLFVVRKSQQRNLINIDELVECALKNGFDPVFPEELSFPEQAKLFLNADVVVGPTGAWLANMIFMRPKTRVNVLYAETCKTTKSMWAQLGELFEIDVVDHYSSDYILNEYQPIHSDFCFPVNAFGHLLQCQ